LFSVGVISQAFRLFKDLIFSDQWSIEDTGPMTVEDEAVTCSQNSRQWTPNGRAQYRRKMEFSSTCV